jgi:predicted MFS family arabinose efflux permease
MGRLLDQPGYGKFWTADTVSMFGSYFTQVALPVLALLTLHTSSLELGLLRAAQWAPYLAFGLIAGVLVDRYPRKPILVGTDLARAALLTLIAVLVFAGWMTMPMLIGFVAVFGAMSLFYEAAHQSFLPRLVSPHLLTDANARMEQSGSVAQSAGPMLGGVVVAAVGAGLALLLDGVSYLVSGLVLARVRVDEPASSKTDRRLWTELREGVRWVYRHPMLAPYALTLHARFFFGAIISTVFLLFFAHEISAGMSNKDIAFGLGCVLALGGLGGVIGAGLSGMAGRRFGIGRISVITRYTEGLACVLLVVAPTGRSGWVVAGVAQFLAWVSLSLAGPNEMGFRQSVTPDRLQARMNATIRSLNWGTITIGAPLGGLLADALGYRGALMIGVIGELLAALVLNLSQYRRAQLATSG